MDKEEKERHSERSPKKGNKASHPPVVQHAERRHAASVKEVVLMRFRRRWYEITWKTLCCSADARFVRLRLSRYSIISFSSATAKGPRRTHAASSGLPSLADNVTWRRGRKAGTHHGHVEGAACNMRARTMLCINPNSASSLML